MYYTIRGVQYIHAFTKESAEAVAKEHGGEIVAFKMESPND